MRKLLLLFTFLIALVSCTHEKPQCVDPWATTGVDSVSFRKDHHYWKNYNLIAFDSIALESAIPGAVSSIYTSDSAAVGDYDEIVVANVAIVPEDSIDSVWIMVARDQMTMGWVRESELKEKSYPDNLISSFIHHFSDARILVLLICLSLAFAIFLFHTFRKERFLMVHFNDIHSFYPTLLCLTMSGSAALYGSVQHYWPGVWEEFYYHPTLNPFGQPTVIMIFLFSVWLMLIILIAVAEDLRRQPKGVNGISYMISLGGVCMILYLFFSLTVQYYIGYICLALYWCFALYRHWTNNSAHYRCGNCGSALHELGRCPRCGAINEK